MDQRHLQEMAEQEDTYWWHRAKRQLVLELLRRHAPPPGLVVEGGVGTGRNLLEFRRIGYEVSGFDFLPAAVEMAHKHGLENVSQLDLHESWPLADESAAAVVMLDVLEHMADPVQVLKNAARVLRPGGVVVLTVPAYQFLFGRWDEILGHHRRYTRQLLRSQAFAAGLEVRWCQHWNAFTLPAAMAMRTAGRIFPRREAAEFPRVPRWLNSALVGCAHVERGLLLRLGLPFGLSVAGVLQHAARELEPTDAARGSDFGRVARIQ